MYFWRGDNYWFAGSGGLCRGALAVVHRAGMLSRQQPVRRLATATMRASWASIAATFAIPRSRNHPSLGVPPTQTCMTCHSQIWTNSSMLEPVRTSYRTDVSLSLDARVNALPDFVYFDHSIHVAKGIGCTTCHGQIAEMPLTYRARHFVHVLVPRVPSGARKIRAAEVRGFQSVLRCLRQQSAGVGQAAGEGIQNSNAAVLFDVSPVKKNETMSDETKNFH